MYKLFDSNNPLIIVLYIIIGILLWINSFIHPVFLLHNHITTAIFYNIFSLFPPNETINHIIVIFAFILLCVEAIILNQIINQNKLFSRNTFLPAFVFILLMSSLKTSQTLTPVLISDLFILIALQKIFYIYDKEEPLAQIFNIGFFTSLATLFYFPSIYVIPVIWTSFMIYRIFSLREWLISLIGFITPYFFIITWLFWTENLGIIYNQYIIYLKGLRFTSYNMSSLMYVYISILGFLIISSLISVFSRNREKLLKTRSSYQVLLWFLLISILAIFIGSDKQTDIFEIAFIPASVFISSYFQSLKKVFYRQFAFIILIILIVISRIYF